MRPWFRGLWQKHVGRRVRVMCNTCLMRGASWEGVLMLVLGVACSGKGAEEALFKLNCAIDDDR